MTNCFLKRRLLACGMYRVPPFQVRHLYTHTHTHTHTRTHTHTHTEKTISFVVRRGGDRYRANK